MPKKRRGAYKGAAYQAQVVAILKKARQAQYDRELLEKGKCVSNVDHIRTIVCESSSNSSRSSSASSSGSSSSGESSGSINKGLKRSRSTSSGVPPDRPSKRFHTLEDRHCTTQSSQAVRSIDDISPHCDNVPSKQKQPEPFTSEACTLHTEYYQVEGNCVFLVEDTLFKLCWQHLIEYSTVFEELLGPYQYGVVAFKRLEDETAEAFAVLCWALITQPDATLKPGSGSPSSDSESLHFGTLFHMATKYKVERYRDWARMMLLGCDLGLMIDWPKPLVHQVLRASSTDSDVAIQVMLCKKWLYPWFGEKKTHMRALNLAERWGLRQLQGFTYYDKLIEANMAQAAESRPAAVRIHLPGLGHAQTVAILQGSRALAWFWEALRIPPKDAGHDAFCGKEWEAMWQRGRITAFDGVREHSPLGALEILARTHPEEGTEERCGCHFAWLANEVYYKLLGALGDYFLGPVVPVSA